MCLENKRGCGDLAEESEHGGGLYECDRYKSTIFDEFANLAKRL